MKRLKDVNWNQVYYFYEVAKRLSMKQASHHLQVSPPTVSEQIKRLEESLGFPLFKREARQLELAPEGQRLYEYARDMFDAGHRFLDAVTSDAIGGYTVRVGLQETLLLSATDFVSDYWDRYAPYGLVSTRRNVFPDQIIERLLRDELDWAVVLTPPTTSRIGCREIGSFEAAFCCSPQIFQRFLREEDIVRYMPLARGSWDVTLNAAVDQHLHRHGVYPGEIVENDHRDICIALAQRGRCVTTLTTDTIRRAPWRAEMTAFRIGEPIEIKLYAVWNEANRKMLPIRKLLELIEAPEGDIADDPLAQLRVSDIPGEALTPET